MKLTRSHLAACGTAAALGVLAVVALGAADGEQVKTIKAPPKAPPVEIRTVVVHRTIRVVKHEKPRKPKTVATPPAPAATQTAQVVPVSQPAQAPAPAPSPKPLSTRTSGGSGSGSGEHESSGEDHGGEHEGYEGGDD